MFVVMTSMKQHHHIYTTVGVRKKKSQHKMEKNVQVEFWKLLYTEYSECMKGKTSEQKRWEKPTKRYQEKWIA